MIWGWPGAFWLLALLMPLAALFLYRRRAVLTIVPSIILWDPYLRLLAGNPLGRHLRRLLALAVQCLILLGMVLALADPQPPRRDREDLAIVVDCSATMQTREAGGLSRLEQAVAAARAAVDDAPGDAALTIIRGGAFPEVVLRSEVDKGRARAALAALVASDTDTDLVEAAHFAQALRSNERPLQVVCISDFCGPAPLWDRLPAGHSADNMPVPQLVQVGSNVPNIGIVDLRVAPDEQHLVVTVGQHGFFGSAAKLHLRINDCEVESAAVRMDGETADVILPAVMKEGDAFNLTLEPSDALPLDNAAFGVWPKRDQIKVRLVSEGNLFLEQALRAQRAAAVERVTPEDWVHGPDVDVTVLDSPISSGLQQLPGQFIVFSPQEPDGAQGLTGMPEESEITFWAADHTILRSAEPDSWGAIRGPVPPLWSGARSLAAAQDRPVLFEWPESGAGTSGQPPSTRVVVFNFDLQNADLPLRPAFPVLLWDTIDYLTGRERVEDVARPTGTTIRVPAAGRQSRITSPSGVTSNMLSSGDGAASWQETHRQGIYEVHQEKDIRRLALNWMSMRSTAPWHALPASQQPQVKASGFGLARWSWREVLLAAIIVIALEWVLFHTRLLRMD
jgi:Ca-activated chloride channel homolog